ncbi:Olfactory receptor 141 [Lemmus lemmus]
MLMGLTDSKEIQLVLSVLFLFIYMATVLGNIGMMLIIRLDVQLHTPMYFFLTHLSFLDLIYSTVITPKTLENLLTSRKSISFMGCFIQLYLFGLLAATECFILSSMAYDRYVAICNPLHYPVIMSTRVYVSLIIASYAGGILHGVIHTVATFSLSFCRSNEITHIFCDIPPLLAISCSETYVNELLLFFFVSSIELVTILIILVSYAFIFLTILKMNSAEGRKKVFSTCGAHLTAVSTLYGTSLFMYVRPSSNYSKEYDMIVSTFYSIGIPMLNPIIYSLRNKDVKEAMRRVLRKFSY